MSEAYKDIAIRAAKTFIQAFISVALVADEPLSVEAFIAAGAAGLSAVWNWVKATY